MNLGYISTVIVGSVMTIGACTSAGIGTPSPAADCKMQAAAIDKATSSIAKLTTAERASIDAQIALSASYCGGTMPSDKVAASKVIQAGTAQITAVLGIAALR